MTRSAQLALVGLISLCSPLAVSAETRTWTGASFNMAGQNNTWSDARNWSPNASPATGDDLILDGGLQATSNNTILAFTAFNRITVKNHVILASNPIALNAGLSAEGAQINLGQIRLDHAQTFTAPTSGAGALITSSIDNNGNLLTVDGPGNFVLTGAISGSGGLTKLGSGILQILGPNSYTGTTRIEGGSLLVSGSQPGSEIHIGNTVTSGGTLGGTGTVGKVSILFAGKIAPGGLNNGTGILTIAGSVLLPNTAAATVEVDLKGTDPGTGYDQLRTSSVFFGNLSFLTVVLDPAFVPARGATFTIVRNDGPDPVFGAFSSKPEGSVFTVGSTTFVISYRGGDGNDVVLRVPAVWDGEGNDDNWSTAANWVGDVVPVAGDLLVFPDGAARPLNNNDYPAGTAFAGLIFTGQFAVTGNRITLGPNGLIARVGAGISAPVTLGGPSLFQADIPSSLVVLGDVDIGPNILTVNAPGNSVVSLQGGLTGTGEIQKSGGQVGRLQLPTSPIAFTGNIRVFSGGLFLGGSQTTAPVSLEPVQNSDPTVTPLSGSGSLGPLTVGGAQVSPGVTNGGGVLTVKGDANFIGSTNFSGTLAITFGGATLNNQDKLKVEGAVKLTKAALSLNLKNGFAPPAGSAFVIIANDGVDPVQGTFASRPEGSTFVVDGTTFRISYHGGDGNDVVLSVAAANPSAAPSPSLGNISTRLRVLEGENVLIGGMIATGSVPKKVIIRAIGPSLTDFGVPGALPDPTLEVFKGGVLVASNDDWRLSPQREDIENSGFAPGRDAESAVIVSLDVNEGYTAIVRGKNGETGIGVVDAFDLDELVAAKLANISTRGFVDVDDNVMIAGLIVAPNGAPDIKVLVRARGPSLGDFGVVGFLADPTLDLVTANGAVVRSNDNWKSSQQAEIEAAQLAPSHDAEAALIQLLPPGAYTAIVRGNGRTTGVGVVEVFNIP